jgi:hypothetical protein
MVEVKRIKAPSDGVAKSGTLKGAPLDFVAIGQLHR